MDDFNERPSPPKSSPRKAYERPRIEQSGKFEHVLLTCSRQVLGQGSCGFTGTPLSS